MLERKQKQSDMTLDDIIEKANQQSHIEESWAWICIATEIKKIKEHLNIE